MMKKGMLGIILILFLFFGFSVSGFAEESTGSDILFSCTKEELKNNKVECEIQLEPKETIKGIELNYQFEDVFSYVESDFHKDTEILEDNSQGFALLFLNGITEKTTIAKISFVISSEAVSGKNYNISLKNINLTNGDKDISIADKVSSIKILSYLDVVKQISIGNDILQLEDGVNHYTFDVDYNVSSIQIGAELVDEDYQFVSNYGPRTVSDLEVGTNEIHLKIAKNEMIAIDYTIDVVRASSLESEMVTENPKTGNTFLMMFIFVLLTLSLFTVLYLYRKNQKREVN